MEDWEPFSINNANGAIWKRDQGNWHARERLRHSFNSPRPRGNVYSYRAKTSNKLKIHRKFISTRVLAVWCPQVLIVADID